MQKLILDKAYKNSNLFLINPLPYINSKEKAFKKC